MLGDWFWNGRVQKSLSSFNTLIDIITHPNFNTTGLRDVPWERINADLVGDSDDEWLDAGWTCTPISLLVPYQTQCGEQCVSDAGPQNYIAGNFYHRKLTSIIHEKITGLMENSQFHFTPYELLWKKSLILNQSRFKGSFTLLLHSSTPTGIYRNHLVNLDVNFLR